MKINSFLQRFLKEILKQIQKLILKKFPLGVNSKISFERIFLGPKKVKKVHSSRVKIKIATLLRLVKVKIKLILLIGQAIGLC